MTAGITVYNTGNIVQIDETYRNMVLLRSGQFTANLANTTADLWYKNFLQDTWVKTTKHAQLFVTCPNPGITMGAGSYRNGYKIPNFFYPQGQSVTFQFYIYDLVGAALSDRVGLQIFDGAATLVYSAYDYPLRLIHHFRASGQGTGTLVYTAPHSNIAIASAGGGYAWDDDGVDSESFFTRLWTAGAQVHARTVSYTNPGGAGGGGYGDPDPVVQVADISNVPLNYVRP
jgi:hypothetical protein